MPVLGFARRARNATSALPILTFHSLDQQSSAISFAPKMFAQSILALRGASYRTLALDVVADALEHQIALPDFAVALTFDDGYASVYRYGFPVLVEHQMTATIFLTVGKTCSERLPSLEGRVMLSWSEIKEMHRNGIAFGAHTLTHPDLTRLTPLAGETEMRESQDRIVQKLGAKVSSFAYPIGRFDASSRASAQKYFTCAVSDRLGWVHGNSDPFTLARLDAYYLQNEKFFSALSARWFRGYVFARSVPRRLRRAWGAR